MNSIINHLSEVNPQKYTLTYQDYVLSGSYITESQFEGSFRQQLKIGAVYGELLSLTCTNYLELSRDDYNCFYLSGQQAGYVMPQLGLSIFMRSTTNYPITIKATIRVYFSENNNPVTSPDYGYGYSGHISYIAYPLSDNDFTRI